MNDETSRKIAEQNRKINRMETTVKEYTARINDTLEPCCIKILEIAKEIMASDKAVNVLLAEAAEQTRRIEAKQVEIVNMLISLKPDAPDRKAITDSVIKWTNTVRALDRTD